MGDNSSIEWTEATWNPVAGCTMLSPGCTHCYAMRLAARLESMGQIKYAGTTRESGGRAVWTGKIKTDHQSLQIPLRWKRPKRIFVNSMSDLFHADVPEEFIAKVWEIMDQANHHTYQILTKRSDRMLRILSQPSFKRLSNVWIGTSIESADYLYRLYDLKQTPAAIRFISFEPLLGPIGSVDLANIDWAIVGGESGPEARIVKKAWVEDLRRTCKRQDVAFFFKQWGGTNKKASGRLLNGRTYDEYPVVASII